MATLLTNYLPILIFLGIALALTLVMVLLPVFLGPGNPDSEKALGL